MERRRARQAVWAQRAEQPQPPQRAQRAQRRPRRGEPEVPAVLPVVDVFWVERAGLEPVPSCCSPADLARAARMALEPGRRWLAARTWVRMVLGDLLSVDAAEVELLAEPSGRPYLGDLHDPTAPEISIAHSDSTVVLAVGSMRLGVDVEDRLPWGTDLLAVASVVASPTELAELAAVPDAQRAMTFQRWWTRKEAVLKAMGVGFLRGPRACHVGAHDLPAPPPPWQVHDLGPVLRPDGAVLCLATEGPAQVRVR